MVISLDTDKDASVFDYFLPLPFRRMQDSAALRTVWLRLRRLS